MIAPKTPRLAAHVLLHMYIHTCVTTRVFTFTGDFTHVGMSTYSRVYLRECSHESVLLRKLSYLIAPLHSSLPPLSRGVASFAGHAACRCSKKQRRNYCVSHVTNTVSSV